MWAYHLGVVVNEQFGDAALSVHQEAVASPLLSESGLVTCSHQRVQLALATAHQLHELKEKPKISNLQSWTFVNARAHLHLSSLNDNVTFNALCKDGSNKEAEGVPYITSCLLPSDNKIQVIKQPPCLSDLSLLCIFALSFSIFLILQICWASYIIDIFFPSCLFFWQISWTRLFFSLIHAGPVVTQMLTQLSFLICCNADWDV